MTWTTNPRGYKTIVSMCAPNSAEVIGPDHETNSHMIAAAPDLLAALEAYELFTGSLANAGEMTPDAWIQLDKLHHKACLALNRAKGA